MSNLNAKEYTSFESIKHISEDGSEFWYARQLAAVLEYTQWRNFAKVIDKARIACGLMAERFRITYLDTLTNLRADAAGEREEWTVLYSGFGDIAQQEGFPDVALAFHKIAKSSV